jgi:predicted NUDIX family NTP pyrophosphohydrolase
MIEKSGGLILFRKRNGENKIEFFLAHPGGPHNKNNDYWLFPKGRNEIDDWSDDIKFKNDEESIIKAFKNTAIREYIEETGDKTPIILNINPIFFGSFKQRENKIVYVFSHKCTWDLKPENCFSNIIEFEYKGEIIKIPENDDYKWMTFDELKNKTHQKHLPYYKKIIEKFGIIEK